MQCALGPCTVSFLQSLQDTFAGLVLSRHAAVWCAAIQSMCSVLTSATHLASAPNSGTFLQVWQYLCTSCTAGCRRLTL